MKTILHTVVYAIVYNMVFMVGLGSFVRVEAVTQGNRLHRIFHHIGTQAHTVPSSHLELGQIVLYFDSEPMVNKGRRDTDNSVERIELFFPGVRLDGIRKEDTIKEQVDKNNAMLYKVHFEQTAVGVKCSITYDTRHVVFDYDSFLSISSQYGVRLHFYNKALLDVMNRSGSLLKTACAKRVPRIVIDCGHGGCDAGAIGVAQLKEKDITLSLGMELADCLHERGFEVSLIRMSDQYVSLEARTSYANTIHGADALVSIHANASKNSNAAGIETYFLEPSLFKKKGGQSGLYEALINTHQKELCHAGKKLAHLIHTHLLVNAQKVHTVCDRQPKAAAAQVLIGTHIPAALVEVGFITNQHEALLLSDKRYQRLLAKGLCEGITVFCDTKNIL